MNNVYICNFSVFHPQVRVHQVHVAKRKLERMRKLAYAPGVRRQRGRPRSSVLGSQVNRLSSMQVKVEPPKSVLALNGAVSDYM